MGPPSRNSWSEHVMHAQTVTFVGAAMCVLYIVVIAHVFVQTQIKIYNAVGTFCYWFNCCLYNS